MSLAGGRKRTSRKGPMVGTTRPDQRVQFEGCTQCTHFPYKQRPPFLEPPKLEGTMETSVPKGWVHLLLFWVHSYIT